MEEEDYDHEDAKKRLRQLKAEQEFRRKRQEEQRKREEEALREQMKLEDQKMQARLQERELEQQRQREERMAKYQQEREQRLQERNMFKRQLHKGPSQVPLYKRREEEYQRKLDEEAAARREELRKKRQAYEPIDFLKLKAEAVEREQALQRASEARRAARLEAERQAASFLPPLPQYYSGKVHERVVAEQHDQKRKVELQREKAKKMQLKAQRYAKLVAELDPAKPSESKPAAGKPAASTDGEEGAPPPPRRLPAPAAVDRTANAAFEPSPQTKQIQAKLSKLNSAIGSKEKAESALKKKDSHFEEELQIRADLSSLYIDAIKYKVELLHSIRQHRSKSC
mmetsp:Transcript_17523/g.44067  ORF Transcript_17523/g.44067 Transcript_17523/m.44067 type:complete len:341 (+) Transcript_17523:18-1040(+)